MSDQTGIGTGGQPGVVIIGAGTAGVTAATTLRNSGYEGALTLLSAESGLPYRRTALSKDLMAADLSVERISLQKPDFWDAKQIDVRASVRAMAVDPDARTVTLDDGTTLDYRALLLATGGSPLRPAWLDAAVPTLRTRDDALGIRDAIAASGGLVVIGGGLIGLELAASAAAHGHRATVLEAADRVAGRVVPAVVSDFLAGIHRERGVDIHTGACAESATGGEVACVDGSRHAGTVVAALGMAPDLALASSAGAETVAEGIVVDGSLATSVAGIYAAGDAAALPDLRTGQPVKGEHWFGATDQGKAAAQSILAGLDGREAPRFTEVPRAWTMQYGVNVQMVGWPSADGDVRVDGEVTAGDATVTTHVGGDLVGAVTIGRAAAARELRTQIAAGLGSSV
ncbi:NAD(P)/FAD-dependent oxidoreductase [Gordonia shandongensis]|uniref:NAD(P)/FAD-dependent oxidoreductase n=1 Tax=Gordonia shandongensis TaxID=376351 RepID=UPI000420D69A|nr:FAD-dependent oxidoreductase [Gordonia shandongensis]